MKSVDCFVGSSLHQTIANERGKVSTLFMSYEPREENPARKRALEEGVRMGGYEINVRKPVVNRTDMQQPMAGYSEFWLG